MRIFTFHHIDPKPHPDPIRQHISITPEGLAQFIQTIRRWGLEIIGFDEVVAAGGPQNIPDNKALITFDDGYTNFYEFAAPVLIAEKCPATMFVLAGKFDGSNDWDQGDWPLEERDRLMTLEMMQSLGKSPLIRFGSHGMYHRKHSQLSLEELHEEMEESYRILSESLGEAFVPVYAFPYGDFNDQALAAIKDSSFPYAVTVENGSWTAEGNPHRIPRYTVFNRDSNLLVTILKLLRHRIPIYCSRELFYNLPAFFPQFTWLIGESTELLETVQYYNL